MAKSKYFVRVKSIDNNAFYAVTDIHNLKFNIMSADIGSTLFSLNLEDVDATALKLTFPFIGFLNWHKPKVACA